MKEPSIEEQVNKTVTDITELYAGWYANSTTLGELSDSIKAILQSERRKAAIEGITSVIDIIHEYQTNASPEDAVKLSQVNIRALALVRAAELEGEEI